MLTLRVTRSSRALTRRFPACASLLAGLLLAAGAHAQDPKPPAPPPAQAPSAQPPSAAQIEAETKAEQEVERDTEAIEEEAERAVEDSPAPAPATPAATAPAAAAPAAAAPAAAAPAATAPPAAAPPAAAPPAAAPPTLAVPPGAAPPGAPYGAPGDPVAWDSRPYVMPYEEGQPIPPGYEIDTTVRKGLVIPGSVIMGGMWLSSLVHGVLMQSDCEDSPCGSESDTFVALMVPVGGPFAAASMTEIGSLRAAALISGTLQAAGLAMFVVGVSARDKRLKRVADRGVEVELVASPTGAMLRGAF